VFTVFVRIPRRHCFYFVGTTFGESLRSGAVDKRGVIGVNKGII